MTVLEATITLEYDDEKTAAAIATAVSPENSIKPPGLFISTFIRNKSVVTRIRAEEKMSMFISTIDDLLFSIATAEKTSLLIKKAI